MSEFEGYKHCPGRATGEAVVKVYKDGEIEVLSLRLATISARDYDSLVYACFPQEVIDEADRLGAVSVIVDLDDLEFMGVCEDVSDISVGKYQILENG